MEKAIFRKSNTQSIELEKLAAHQKLIHTCIVHTVLSFKCIDQMTNILAKYNYIEFGSVRVH